MNAQSLALIFAAVITAGLCCLVGWTARQMWRTNMPRVGEGKESSSLALALLLHARTLVSVPERICRSGVRR